MINREEWLIKESQYDSDRLRWSEVLFTQSTGSLGIRNVLEERPEGYIGGSYLGGVFNTGMSWSNDMANLPDFTALDVKVNGERLSVDSIKVISHERILDMYENVVLRNTVFELSNGSRVTWKSQRFISMDKLVLFCEKHIFETDSEDIVITSKLDATTTTYDTHVINKVSHYKVKSIDSDNNILKTTVALTDSKRKIAAVSLIDALGGTVKEENNVITYTVKLENKNGKAEVCKYSVLACDIQFSCDIENNTVKLVKEAKAEGFDKLFETHSNIMKELWADADFVIDGDDVMQKKIRYNIFALICAAPRRNELASIGARGLTGDRYRGHIYWDTEMFMLPFYILTDPKTAKDVLMFRYHKLDGARRNAVVNYNNGARFPYQSADTGDEASPIFGFNSSADPEKFAKDPLYHFVLGPREVQITASVMFGMYEYYKLTNDREFMLKYGLEMFIETARFWVSRMEWVEENNRYEILGVIGPDEFHEEVDNNAYTNYMVWLNIDRAIKLYKEYVKENETFVSEMTKRIGFDEKELKEFEEHLEKLYLPQSNKDGVIEQFDGYFDLPEYSKGDLDPVDLIRCDFTGKPIPNMAGPDLVTFADRTRTKVIKQCDTILLMCMAPDMFDEDIILKNYDYYEPRTMHASSLSPNTASIMGVRCGRGEHSYSLMDLSASIDINNVQLNSHHGLHMASIGGTWMNIMYGYGGLKLSLECDAHINPVLAPGWNSIKYRLCIKDSVTEVYYDGKTLNLKLIKGEKAEFVIKGEKVCVKDEVTIEM